MRKIDILAPVGSWESLQAAIQAGADAVYFGLEQLNMRAKSAGPFTIDNLPEMVEACHSKKVKAYLTLNTILYDHDMQLATRIVKECKHCGVDAVIVSDMAAIEICREVGIPIHISTQANVSNVETVRFFSQFADVVVLARELTLKQIETICREITRRNICGPSGELVKIEVFVHGALCMAVSGKCYLSLHTQNSSANRGACTQNCRHTYEVTDKETGAQVEIDNEFIMSAKDLCTIDMLDKIIESGVSVLKIEGRSKGADYVDVTTRCYKEAAAACLNDTFTLEKVEDWKKRLDSVFNRGFWEGYYLGRKLGEWADTEGSIATEKKIYLGRGTKYYPNIRVAEFAIETGQLKSGDTILITSPKFGIRKFTINAFSSNGRPSGQAGKGDRLTFPFEERSGKQEKLYKIVSS